MLALGSPCPAFPPSPSFGLVPLRGVGRQIYGQERADQSASDGGLGADPDFWSAVCAARRASASVGRGSCGQFREVGGGATVDLGDRVGVVPQRGRAPAAVAEASGGVPQVEPAGEELTRGVMPSALDGELHPAGCIGRLRDLVGGPVQVPRPGVGRVVGEQVCGYSTVGLPRIDKATPSNRRTNRRARRAPRTPWSGLVCPQPSACPR
jgi:hypothetical protein